MHENRHIDDVNHRILIPDKNRNFLPDSFFLRERFSGLASKAVPGLYFPQRQRKVSMQEDGGKK